MMLFWVQVGPKCNDSCPSEKRGPGIRGGVLCDSGAGMGVVQLQAQSTPPPSSHQTWEESRLFPGAFKGNTARAAPGFLNSGLGKLVSTKFVVFVAAALKNPIHAPLFYTLYLFILELESEPGLGVGGGAERKRDKQPP